MVFANLPYEYHPKKYKWFSTFFLHLNRGPTGVNFSRQIGYDTVFGSQGVKMGIGGKQRIRWKRRQIGTLNLMNIFLEIESALAVHDPGLNLWPCPDLKTESRVLTPWSWSYISALINLCYWLFSPVPKQNNKTMKGSPHDPDLLLWPCPGLTVFPMTQTKQ